MGFRFRKFLILGLIFSGTSLCAHAQSLEPVPKKAKAFRPLFEISLMGALSKTDYGSGSYGETRRVSGSVAVYITSLTEIELSYTDSRTLSNYEPSPKTVIKTKDRTAAISVDQYLTPRSWFLQPYVKAGAAQLNRTQETTINGKAQPEISYKQPSGVLGAGVRMSLIWTLGLKLELTTYLPNFNIRGAKNNYEWNAGVSVQF